MDKPTPQNNNKSDKNTKNLFAYSGMAFEMFAIIGLFTTAGFFLDGKMNTSPILVIIFLLVGLVFAFYRIYKQVV